MKKLSLTTALAASLAFAAPESAFTFRELGPKSLELSENGKPIFVYNAGATSGYLHPVYANDGTVLTGGSEGERGIWWAWPVVSVNGQVVERGLRQEFERWTQREAKPRFAVLGIENTWYAGEQKIVRETAEIRVESARNGTRRIEFTLKFESLNGAVEIAGDPDQNIGSGGFCFRFAPRDGGEGGTVMRTEQGIEDKDGVQILRAWGQIDGRFDGRIAGARIEDGHLNAGSPNAWIMRRGPGLINVAFPGLRPASIEPGKPLVLRYRVTLFSGKVLE